jgi:hypothetical protein
VDEGKLETRSFRDCASLNSPNTVQLLFEKLFNRVQLKNDLLRSREMEKASKKQRQQNLLMNPKVTFMSR